MSGIRGIGDGNQDLLLRMQQIHQQSPSIQTPVEAPADVKTDIPVSPVEQFDNNLFVNAGEMEVGKAYNSLHAVEASPSPGIQRSLEPSQAVDAPSECAASESLQGSARSVSRPWDNLEPKQCDSPSS